METIADGIERNTKVRRERKDFSTVGGNTGGATMEDDDGVLKRVSLRNRRYGGRERGKSAFVRSSVERESAVVEGVEGERGDGKEQRFGWNNEGEGGAVKVKEEENRQQAARKIKTEVLLLRRIRV
jgi:hypothetical protein